MTLRDLYRAIGRRWLLVLLAGAAGAALAAAIAFSMRPIYRAYVLMSPIDDSATLGSLGAIAGRLTGLLGATSGAAGLLGGINKAEAVAIVKSHAFTERFIDDVGLLHILFADDWNAETQTWTGKTRTLQDAVVFFDEEVRFIVEDRQTGLYKLAIDWHERDRAAVWANLLVERLNDTVRKMVVEQASAQIEYLNNELRKTEVLELRLAMSRLIESQLQMIAMATVRKDYAFRVLDPAFVSDPDKYHRPLRVLMIVVGLFFGLSIGILVAIWTQRPESAGSRG